MLLIPPPPAIDNPFMCFRSWLPNPKQTFCAPKSEWQMGSRDKEFLVIEFEPPHERKSKAKGQILRPGFPGPYMTLHWLSDRFCLKFWPESLKVQMNTVMCGCVLLHSDQRGAGNLQPFCLCSGHGGRCCLYQISRWEMEFLSISMVLFQKETFWSS